MGTTLNEKRSLQLMTSTEKEAKNKSGRIASLKSLPLVVHQSKLALNIALTSNQATYIVTPFSLQEIFRGTLNTLIGICLLVCSSNGLGVHILYLSGSGHI